MQVYPMDAIFYELTKSKVLSHNQKDGIVSKTINLKIGEEFYERIKGMIKEDTGLDELSKMLEEIEIEKYGEKIKTKECPYCKKKALLEVVFGLPSQQCLNAADNGLIKLKGCCLPEDYEINEYWYCRICNKEVKINRNIDKKIFRFVEKDAWGISCDKDILIIDSKKENVILNSEYVGIITFSIDYEDILKIKQILEERKYIFRIKKAQSPLILDGSKQYVSFWNDGLANEIETDNLDKWDLNNCNYRNTKYLLKVIDEISEILKKYSIKLF